ncbi:MAG: DoxX family protein [Bacteroidetes bacterium GWD2_45_23]|nr:MAG: DoxX family protein [Bacteroidetes bacterium GWC2_46_850]OFX75156.1 MAG: DoxX family protein [Bacteroidetes bacterium GWC1_47_7]OFX86167.1 MAG: DoxX family protein [Bacteroidetes bacterium GWD2_45_23]HAR37415.1 DoxX family protein [Porphyromonadaceae bacterium]HCC17298.1 DoxX family protein [Porphyromonadaceae bacterium]
MKQKNNLLQAGWLILRVGIGISIFLHGYPKITGGAETWTMIGGTMSNFGIDFAPAFWGFLAAFVESVGGLLFALGLLFRPAALLLAGNMAVALITHVVAGDNFMIFGHAMDLLIVFAASILIGAGKYSLDAKLFPKIA